MMEDTEENFDFIDFEAEPTSPPKAGADEDGPATKVDDETDECSDRRESLLFNESELDFDIENYVLPDNPKDIDVDPRTGLEIIDIPPEYRQSIGLKLGQPVLHFIDSVDKFNSRGKWEKRYVVVTNYCVYLVRQTKEVARCLPVNKITGIAVAGNDIIALMCATEFDMCLRLSSPELREKALQVAEKLCRSRMADKDTKFQSSSFSDIAGLKVMLNLNKPKNWTFKNHSAHSKSELWQHLKLMKSKNQLIPNNVDPRTDLKIIKLPKGLAASLAEQTFYPGSEAGLVHFFAPVLKVNSKLDCDRRIVLVSNTAVYLLYPTGDIQRCLRIMDIGGLYQGKTYVGLKSAVPHEFDMMLKFGTEATNHQYLECDKDANLPAMMVDIIQGVHLFRANKLLEIDNDPDNIAELDLSKPKKWTKTYVAITSHRAMLAHLKRLGFKFTADSSTNDSSL